MCHAAATVSPLSVPAFALCVSRLLTAASHFFPPPTPFTRARFDTRLLRFALSGSRRDGIGFLCVDTRTHASVRLLNGFGRSDNRLRKIDLFLEALGDNTVILLYTLFPTNGLSDCH